MITWLNGKPVMAKMSHNFESLEMQLSRFNPKTKQLEFIDKHGFKYYTNVKNVEFIDMPEDKVEKISDLMIYSDGDYFE